MLKSLRKRPSRTSRAQLTVVRIDMPTPTLADLLASVALAQILAGQSVTEVDEWVSSPDVATRYGTDAQRAVRTVLVGARPDQPAAESPDMPAALVGLVLAGLLANADQHTGDRSRGLPGLRADAHLVQGPDGIPVLVTQ